MSKQPHYISLNIYIVMDGLVTGEMNVDMDAGEVRWVPPAWPPSPSGTGVGSASACPSSSCTGPSHPSDAGWCLPTCPSSAASPGRTHINTHTRHATFQLVAGLTRRGTCFKPVPLCRKEMAWLTLLQSQAWHLTKVVVLSTPVITCSDIC